LEIDIRIKSRRDIQPTSHFWYISQLAHAIAETRGDCGEDGRNQQNKGRIAAQQQAPVASWNKQPGSVCATPTSSLVPYAPDLHSLLASIASRRVSYCWQLIYGKYQFTMRMTRAQAAALAAAGDEADVAVEHHDDHDNNGDEKNESTTPTGESEEREALGELDNHLDTTNHEDTDAVPGEDVEESGEHEQEQEAEQTKAEEKTNGEAQNGDMISDQGTTNPVSTTSTNMLPTSLQ
jgi:hypothetical protein